MNPPEAYGTVLLIDMVLTADAGDLATMSIAARLAIPLS